MVTRADYEQYLMHTQYHWILGVRTLAHFCQPNLWEQINGMTEDEVATMRQTQVEIKQKIWLIRAIYWLFNIYYYAEQYYQLMAYDELQTILDEEHIPEMRSSYFSKQFERWYNSVRPKSQLPNPTPSEFSHLSARETEDSLTVAVDATTHGNTLVPTLPAAQEATADRQASSKWLRALSLFGYNAQQPPVDGLASSLHSQPGMSQRFVGKSRKPKPSFPARSPAPEMLSRIDDNPLLPQPHTSLIVQTSMLDSLALLTLPQVVGDTLSMDELKRAYRAQALIFHPDKNPSPEAKEQFVWIANAYETLKTIMEGKCATEQVVYNNYTDIWRHCDELSHDFRNLARDFTEIGQDYTEISQGLRDIRHDFVVIQRDTVQLIDQIRAETERLQARVDQTEREQAERAVQIAERNREIAERNREIAERARNIAETNQLIAELHARRSPSPN